MKLEKITARGVTNLYRHPKTGIIYYRKYQKDLGEIYKSTRTEKLEEAKARARAFEKKPELVKRAESTFALDLFDKWVERKRALNARPNTITSMLASRKHLAPFIEMLFCEDLSDDWWINTYIPGVRAKTHPGRKFMNDRKWLKGFLKEMHKAGTIKRLPELKNPDVKRRVGRVFSDEEVSDLINFAQTEDLRLAILMAVTMGMRRLEIFSLQVARVNSKTRVITLTEADTKTKKARKFGVSEAVWPLLKERLTAGSPWVFASKVDPSRPVHKDGYVTAWTNLKKMCGIQGRFHDLRHTFLTKAFKAPGANPALICHYAGLSLEVAEQVYLHFDEEDTRGVASLVTYA